MRKLKNTSAEKVDENGGNDGDGLKHKEEQDAVEVKHSDDDVGADGDDDTTDDEGGIDTPPPREEEEDEIKEKSAKGEEKKNNMKKKKVRIQREVDQIMDMEIKPRRKCSVYFRVRWIGMTEKEDTWKPETELNCLPQIKEFLEISGRNSEYERALAAKLGADSCRASTRTLNAIHYSELDEDEEEILPSGTKTRKVRTKAEKKIHTFKSPVRKKKKTEPKKGEYEVGAVLDHRVKGRFTEYRIRWKGYNAKYDTWEPESNLSCAKLIQTYHDNLKYAKEEEKEYEVEQIVSMRGAKGKEEYKVRWKGYGPKCDSWLPEDELNCSDLLKNYKEALHQLEADEDWQVEKILDDRVKKGKIEYLIHWKNFESKHDSWEPEDNLQGCKDVLDKYLDKKEKEKKKPQSANRAVRQEKNQAERLADDSPVGSRSTTKRRGSKSSFSQFYEN